jgi:hypothetical protein
MIVLALFTVVTELWVSQFAALRVKAFHNVVIWYINLLRFVVFKVFNKKIGGKYFIFKVKTMVKYLKKLNLVITKTNASFEEFTINVKLIIQ